MQHCQSQTEQIRCCWRHRSVWVEGQEQLLPYCRVSQWPERHDVAVGKTGGHPWDESQSGAAGNNGLGSCQAGNIVQRAPEYFWLRVLIELRSGTGRRRKGRHRHLRNGGPVRWVVGPVERRAWGRMTPKRSRSSGTALILSVGLQSVMIPKSVSVAATRCMTLSVVASIVRTETPGCVSDSRASPNLGLLRLSGARPVLPWRIFLRQTRPYPDYHNALSRCQREPPRDRKPRETAGFSGGLKRHGMSGNGVLAEREGFEPSVPVKGTTVFETAPIDRSGTSPSSQPHIQGQSAAPYTSGPCALQPGLHLRPIIPRAAAGHPATARETVSVASGVRTEESSPYTAVSSHEPCTRPATASQEIELTDVTSVVICLASDTVLPFIHNPGQSVVHCGRIHRSGP